MTTPTGQISMLDVIEELDGAPTPRPITLNDEDVRGLAGVPTGEISMDDLRGKSSTTALLSMSFIVQDSTFGFEPPSVGYREGDPLTIISATGVFDGMSSIAALRKTTTTGHDSYYSMNFTVLGTFPETLQDMPALRQTAIVEYLLDNEPPRYVYNASCYTTTGSVINMYAVGGTLPTILTAADIGKTLVLNVYPATDVLVATFDLLPRSKIDDYNVLGWGVDWVSIPAGSITNVAFHNGFTGTSVPYAYVGFDNGDKGNPASQYCYFDLKTSVDESSRNFMVRSYNSGTESTRYSAALDNSSYTGGSTLLQQTFTRRPIDWSDQRQVLVWYWDWEKAP